MQLFILPILPSMLCQRWRLFVFRANVPGKEFMECATQQLSLWQPDETGTTEKKIVYISPSVEQLEQCAKQICQRLGQTVDPIYDTQITYYEFTAFLKVAAEIQAKSLNKQPKRGTPSVQQTDVRNFE